MQRSAYLITTTFSMTSLELSEFGTKWLCDIINSHSICAVTYTSIHMRDFCSSGVSGSGVLP